MAAGLSALSLFLVRLYFARAFVSKLRRAQLVSLSSYGDRHMRYDVSKPEDWHR